MKNRKLETCTSGSVRDEAGQPPHLLGRRRFLHLVAGAVAVPAVSRAAWAQGYPSRPVRIIVGFAPGGSADLMTRLIGQWLSERLGQPMIIENRPGAGTNIAVQAVVNASPDGYTLLSLTSSNAANVTSFLLTFAGLIRNALVLAVNPSLPVKSVSEFIAYAKFNPGEHGVIWRRFDKSSGSGTV